jgi:hypothetical protein
VTPAALIGYRLDFQGSIELPDKLHLTFPTLLVLKPDQKLRLAGIELQIKKIPDGIAIDTQYGLTCFDAMLGSR